MSRPRRESFFWSPWLEEVAAALRRETVGFNRRDLVGKTVRAITYRRTMLREKEAPIYKAASRLLAVHLEILNGLMKCDAELRRRGYIVRARETADPLETAMKLVESGRESE
jgi:hypothetical protein